MLFCSVCFNVCLNFLLNLGCIARCMLPKTFFSLFFSTGLGLLYTDCTKCKLKKKVHLLVIANFLFYFWEYWCSKSQFLCKFLSIQGFIILLLSYSCIANRAEVEKQ